MLKRIICLLVLMLVSGCATKQQASSPEQMLADIGGSYWELGIEKSLAHENGYGHMTTLRDAYGRDELERSLAGLGFEIDAVKRSLNLYDSPGELVESLQFTLKPETGANAAAQGAREVRLLLENGGSRYLGDMVALRYTADGNLLLFTHADMNLLGVFVPRGK